MYLGLLTNKTKHKVVLKDLSSQLISFKETKNDLQTYQPKKELIFQQKRKTWALVLASFPTKDP